MAVNILEFLLSVIASAIAGVVAAGITAGIKHVYSAYLHPRKHIKRRRYRRP